MDCVATDDGAVLEAVAFLSFFKDLPDPRQPGKVTYPLDEVLLLAGWVECETGLHLRSWWSYGRRGDGSEQVRPVLEVHVNGHSPRVLEEAVCRTARDNCGSPDKIGEIGGGVESEGEQVERDEDVVVGSLSGGVADLDGEPIRRYDHPDEVGRRAHHVQDSVGQGAGQSPHAAPGTVEVVRVGVPVGRVGVAARGRWRCLGRWRLADRRAPVATGAAAPL